MMKRRFILLLVSILLLFAVSCNDTSGNGTTPNGSFGESGQFVFDTEGLKPESLSNIWICPKSLDNGGMIPHFADDLTNKDNWPTLLENTSHLKLYIEYIGRASSADLRKIADFVRENKLWVTVEVAGLRSASTHLPADEIGYDAAEREFLKLSKFLLVGGRVDYITADHPMAEELTNRNDVYPEMTLQELCVQQMNYYERMQDYMPNLKVGTIESLGFFWVKSPGVQHQSTDPNCDRVDFETYFSEFVRIAEEKNITIDHFHIDFGLHDIEHDSGYSRVLAVEDFVHSKNVKVSLIATNAFHNVYMPVDTPENIEKASQHAADETLRYFEGYMAANGRSDYLVFQRWQPIPVAVGNEKSLTTNFGIFKSLLDSPAFPKK